MKEERSSFVYALPETFVTLTDEGEPLTQRGYALKVAQVWADLKERWDTYGHKLDRIEPADARRVWTMPLLEALGFEPEPLRKQIQVSDRLTFRFSHKGWGINPRYHNPPITHIVPPVQGLDSRIEKGKPSPHNSLQQYLNVHDDSWALVTNGLYLRVLRDYHHTYVKGYVEFDLEAIFLTRSFRDFQALYRIAHASRFTAADTGNPYLEEYFQHSQLVGEKVGAKLRENVVLAVTALGNGFLNDQLLTELRADGQKCHEFYEEILRIIYRIIFLLYAEQRGMLASGDKATHHDLYLEQYSMSALRERARADYRKGDRHTDHWEGLRSTFEMLRHGAPELGIYPYGGMLFDTNRDNYVERFTCKNSELLKAVYYLTTTEIDGAIHRISYADLDVVEVGAIYESLLENIPRITDTQELINNIDYPANSFILDPRALTRKTTGSYYTQQGLIKELIASALEPIISDRLLQANDRQSQEDAVLSIKICDPACGSGAFLIAACNYLGERLASVRSDDSVLTEDLLQQGRRDVLQHCIYGVDLNPMAIELVKVSLWISALVKNKPLNFLDHHLKCGNSLIGITSEFMVEGIPDEAFNPVTGDKKSVADHARRLNKLQRQNASLSGWIETERTAAICSSEFAKLSNVDELTPEAVQEKNRNYNKLLKTDVYSEARFLADLWTSAFFWPLAEGEQHFPTQHVFHSATLKGSAGVTTQCKERITKLAQEHLFFHWALEFPDVFLRDDPGFDCILGNPPWEFVEVREKEFFQYHAPQIVEAETTAARKQKIQDLATNDPRLYNLYTNAKRKMECDSKFMRSSSRYPLTGKGNINTYPVFTEHATKIIRSTGRVGIVVPSGIATDARTAEFFRSIIERRQLVSLFDFENRKKVFPIDSRYKFCLLTLTGNAAPSQHFKISFFLQDIRDLFDPDKKIELSKEDIDLINPNTSTCPIFRSRRDAMIVKHVYELVPILISENRRDSPWRIIIRHGPINISHDSELLKSGRALKHEGYILDGAVFTKLKNRYLPHYEGKMTWIYNHRLCSTEKAAEDETLKEGSFKTSDISSLTDPNYYASPRYWVQEDTITSRLTASPSWFCACRRTTNNTNERTAICAIIPFSAAGDLLNLVLFDDIPSTTKAVFVANFNSFVFDYITRQKVGGTSLSLFIFKQLPLLPPSAYTNELERKIAGKVLELSYTCWDLQGFAKELGYVDHKGRTKPPLTWSEDRRAHLQAELDAIYAHLYGISREDLDYILDTFPIVKRKDEQKYGTYLTKELIFKYYDDYAGSITTIDGLVS
jgi:hypothetical protein